MAAAGVVVAMAAAGVGRRRVSVVVLPVAWVAVVWAGALPGPVAVPAAGEEAAVAVVRREAGRYTAGKGVRLYAHSDQ